MKQIFFIAILLFSSAAAQAEGPSFKGYACTDDCSGHRAGYAWAERKGIVDPAECGGNSQSFIEGCRSFTVEFEDAPPEDVEIEAETTEEE